MDTAIFIVAALSGAVVSGWIILKSLHGLNDIRRMQFEMQYVLLQQCKKRH